MDKIIIRDLALKTIIGTFPEERKMRQEVIFNVELSCDLSRASCSDELDDTIDYKNLKQRIMAMVEASQFLLIERLAGAVADLCLEDRRVVRARVTIDKPGALRFCRSVAVEIDRVRG